MKQCLASPPLLSKPEEGDILHVYLAVSPHAVSVALVKEEGNIQKLVYYMSWAI